MMTLLTFFKNTLGINNEEKRALWHLGAKILESDFEKNAKWKIVQNKKKGSWHFVGSKI